MEQKEKITLSWKAYIVDDIWTAVQDSTEPCIYVAAENDLTILRIGRAKNGLGGVPNKIGRYWPSRDFIYALARGTKRWIMIADVPLDQLHKIENQLIWDEKPICNKTEGREEKNKFEHFGSVSLSGEN